MRKSLIAAAVIAAGVFAWYKFGAPQSAGQLGALDYVPADTAVFSAQLEPVDLPSYLSSIGMGPQYYSTAALAQLDAQLQAAQSSSEKFVLALGRQYFICTGNTPTEISVKTGIKTQMRRPAVFGGGGAGT